MKKWIRLLGCALILICIGVGVGYLLADEKPVEAPVEEAAKEEKTSISEKREELRRAVLKEKEEEENRVEQESMAEPLPAGGEICICIDPGHYGGANTLYFEDGTSYCEGDVTLKLAQRLKEILCEKYGISVRMTRESDSIQIGGYADGALDGEAIHLRGELAEGCDLFLSLHTNANNDQANGYPTCEQPVSINKPLLIANRTAREDASILALGNRIGSHLTEVHKQSGIASADTFQEHTEDGSLLEWTDIENDRLNVPGTIYIRSWEDSDYYGVLRGASNVGVPGFIIEHGFHTVPEVREQIAAGELIEKWAQADAKGIAEGFGLVTE